MKKYKLSKKSKSFKPAKPDDMIDELNAVSATDFTGLIPANPNHYEEENYEDVFPQGFPDTQA